MVRYQIASARNWRVRKSNFTPGKSGSSFAARPSTIRVPASKSSRSDWLCPLVGSPAELIGGSHCELGRAIVELRQQEPRPQSHRVESAPLARSSPVQSSSGIRTASYPIHRAGNTSTQHSIQCTPARGPA